MVPFIPWSRTWILSHLVGIQWPSWAGCRKWCVFFLRSGEGFSKNWHIFSLNFFKNLRADVWKTFPCTPNVHPPKLNKHSHSYPCRILSWTGSWEWFFVHHQQLAATSRFHPLDPPAAMEISTSYAGSTHFFFIKQAFVQDYNVKDLTKIYKGPEVLMNCPSLGLEPNGVWVRKFPGFSGGSRLGMWSLRVPKNNHACGCSDWELIDFFGIWWCGRVKSNNICLRWISSILEGFFGCSSIFHPFPEEMHLQTVIFRCHAVRLPDDVRLSGWDPKTISWNVDPRLPSV